MLQQKCCIPKARKQTFGKCTVTDFSDLDVGQCDRGLKAFSKIKEQALKDVIVMCLPNTQKLLLFFVKA